ncbi:putative major facilitator superfamily transporter protein [Botrytis fragariae]|uniref:Putative major facilitator superfamily transporter protein n=1 Tax=Botrytis fragariae TaxID=1964551 RepID=A0A8H6EIP1_9HELO|nr:putative major facilitator superfamily transporter protein [Botrytis fragariae]KAF5873692.1 putative major facilitator superfamily transporter protein [Botrytis fragariae]
MSVSRYLPFASRTTDAQAVTYLLAVCLFSISFLVFLNSSVSFVITDLIGVKEGVGDLVGTLGFADELVALLACPAWGILSDRLGVRVVCVLGYLIVGLALILFVQAKNVFPQLLLARLFFSVGGAATATMVTAILPSMSARETDDSQSSPISRSALPENIRHSIATESIDSEITITPTNYNDRRGTPLGDHSKSMMQTGSSPPRLAGLVGLFTGCGALVALIAFLPLPAQFSRMKGVSQGQAVADSFYVVGVVSLMVSCFCFIGLRGLAGEEGKGWRLLLGRPIARDTVGHPGGRENTEKFQSYWTLISDSTILGFKDAQIGLGYLGGFVARASSVGISLFIPLYINSYFIGHGFCQGSPNDPSPELKKECRRAYVLAAELTGASQLIALLCAPLFGYLSDRYRRFNIPLLTASVFGVIGYIGFAQLVSPEPQDINGRGGSPIVFVMVALIGISQIGAIVCSLGLLGRGVLGDEGGYNLSSQLQDARSDENTDSRDITTETAPLIAPPSLPKNPSRNHLKGSIAGVYSLSGGAAILLLTKLGGYLFDNLSTGAPFYMMAIFNAMLLVIGIGAGVYREIRTAQKHR